MATLTLRAAKGAPLTNAEVDANFVALNNEAAALALAVDGKADAPHGHAIGSITGLQTALDDKAFVSHTHSATQITVNMGGPDATERSVLARFADLPAAVGDYANADALAIGSARNVTEHAGERRFAGPDGSLQMSVGWTHNAAERWHAVGGIAGVGATLAVLSDTSADADGNFVAKGRGMLVFGNGTGMLAVVADSGAAVRTANQPMLRAGAASSPAVFTAFSWAGETNVGLAFTPLGTGGLAFGDAASYRGITGKAASASGRFAVDGDAQEGRGVLRQQSTGATGVRLTSDGAAPSTLNSFNLPNNCSMRLSGSWVARQTGGAAGTAGDTAGGDWTILVKRGANAAATAKIANATVSKENDAAAAAWTFAVDVDTTNGGLSLTGTGEANKNINWVATVRSTEVIG
jgi:hypothetical protein